MFKEVFGETLTETILHNIGIRGSSIEIEAFAESLERLFGSAAHILEIYILKRLYSQAGRPFQEKSGRKFVDYINEVKTLRATGKNERKA